MGIKDWRRRHSFTDPVRGQFQVTGRYFAHPNSSSYREVLTGVVTGPGVAPTAGEHLDDVAGRYVGHDVLPVLLERTRPGTFAVLWDEIPKPDFRADARAQAEAAAVAARTPPPARPPADTDGSTPAWAGDMVADLVRQGLLPGVPSDGSGPAPIVVTVPDRVVDLTAGHVSAAGAADLMSTGEPASAVLLSVAEVDVPRQALPGPTASLCDLALRVTRSSGECYEAQTRLGFRDAQRRAAIAVLGSTLPVRVDPHDRTRVVVDSVTYDAQHRS